MKNGHCAHVIDAEFSWFKCETGPTTPLYPSQCCHCKALGTIRVDIVNDDEYFAEGHGHGRLPVYGSFKYTSTFEGPCVSKEEVTS